MDQQNAPVAAAPQIDRAAMWWAGIVSLAILAIVGSCLVVLILRPATLDPSIVPVVNLLVSALIGMGGAWLGLSGGAMIKVPAQPAPALPRPASSDPPQPAIPVKPATSPGPFATAPPWFTLGLHDIGFHETGNNGGIERFIAQAHTGAVGEPWCAIWTNAKLEQAGIQGTRSPSSQSFKSDPGFVQLPGPALGCIVVYWRGGRTSGLGHVGLYVDETATHIRTLGGNENDMVQIEPLPKDAATFGVVGFYWPKSIALPHVGPIPTPPGAPLHVQVDPTGGSGSSPAPAPPSAPGARQVGITATMFAGPGDPEKNGYTGQLIDASQPGVALPFTFPDPHNLPVVRVTNPKTGQAVTAAVVDKGPWNTDDPYWETGARPQAESGTDRRGRRTNRAGIDLTNAAAAAISIDGKGLVDWEFVTAPASPATPATPHVT